MLFLIEQSLINLLAFQQEVALLDFLVHTPS